MEVFCIIIKIRSCAVKHALATVIPAKQRAKWTCLHVHLATAARVKYPAARCGENLMPRQLAAGYLTRKNRTIVVMCGRCDSVF